MKLMTTIAEKLHLLTPQKPLEHADPEEVRELRRKIYRQIHDREIAVTRISVATDSQVREANHALRAVQGVLAIMGRRPKHKIKRTG